MTSLDEAGTAAKLRREYQKAITEALNKDEWIEATPEFWEEKRAEARARRKTRSKQERVRSTPLSPRRTPVFLSIGAVERLSSVLSVERPATAVDFLRRGGDSQ